uniref:Uncharacterized protein n=1 Tax=Arundo donax TaxID=35708 RepID=A0A0A9EA15_ARUDO
MCMIRFFSSKFCKLTLCLFYLCSIYSTKCSGSSV